jgi:hypothetical protein
MTNFMRKSTVALAAVALFAASSLHLLNLTGLRDYARAPFMLMLIALVMALALRPFAPRWVIGIATLCGALVGIGYGVRPDVVVEFPLLVVTLLCFLPGGMTRNLRIKGLAIAADRHHAELADSRGDRRPGLAQLFSDPPRGLLFLERQFGVPVQVLVELDERVQILLEPGAGRL